MALDPSIRHLFPSSLSRISTHVSHAGASSLGSATTPVTPVTPVTPASPASPMQRTVRTVPPSAAFDPPSPQTPHQELPQPQAFETSPQPLSQVDPTVDPASTSASTSTPAPAPAPAPVPASAQRKRRRLARVSYDTSDSSGDESDEEPPWWTFTQRGMAKMRSRMIQDNRGRSGRDTDHGVSGPESGLETTRERHSRSLFRRGSKQSTKSNTSKRTLASSRNHSPANSRAGTPRLRLPNGNNEGRPSSLLGKLSVGSDLQQPGTVPARAPVMKRSTSAPSAAQLHIPSLPPAIRLPSQTSSSVSILHRPDRSSSGPKPIASPKKSFSGSSFPYFRKRDSDIQTDTDASNVATPRPKPKKPPSRSSTQETPGEEDNNHSPEPSTQGPGQLKGKRRQANRLKIHMPHGWPQAGTWQDAYHGYQSMPAPLLTSEPVDLASETTVPLTSKPKRRSRMQEALATPERSERSGPPFTHGHPRTVKSGPTHRKARKNRRYRQALVPPTPVGLGFTPLGDRRPGEEWKEGRVGASSGFDWTNGTATTGDPPHGARSHNAIEEANELARTETAVTTEKSDTTGSDRRRRRWFGLGVGLTHKRGKSLSFRERWRRMLFLDARVTIHIRLINLAIVICSLVLAVQIREDLRTLRVPGLLGSSTVLLIAFSAFTMLHVVTAIYREYFGRPIGLWGLRSKMLWVCLDLAFIALWSSTLSLAINDFIATALDCTETTPWWRRGLSESYRSLLKSLDITNAQSAHVTSYKAIASTLGTTLPSEITSSKTAHAICDKQVGSIALALVTLVLYTVNTVLSLFRIFETVRRTANVNRAVMA